ncbi:hypothetical protein BV898_11806 [Hypsibius exemplaris]|uniref:Carboxylesterase type B domain-containing protein n=1 Tax=Hypsibius exemplaris TaxID=2072580 RepID=A0A1W0WFP0_HYPEX|nr:hypothetical protein BV898_11806 [Hypsibius exemplaris]
MQPGAELFRLRLAPTTIFILLLYVCCFLYQSHSLTVETVYEALFTGVADIGFHRFAGDLYWVSADGESKAYAYYGIKYGISKRFEASWLNSNFSYMAAAGRDKFGPQCMQSVEGQNAAGMDSRTSGIGQARVIGRHLPGIPALNTSEDCLFLDIYTPPVYRNHRQWTITKRPVLMFVHGGGFAAGNKSPGIGTELSRVSNIIVVSVQYRLGMFGFLSTADANATGNYGLGDVKKACNGSGRASAGSAGILINHHHGQGAGRHAGVSHDGWIQRFEIANSQDIVSAAEAAFPSFSGPVEYRFALAIDGDHIPYRPDWVLSSQPWDFRGGVVSGFMADDASLALQDLWTEIFTTGKPTLQFIQTTFLPMILRSVTGCSAPSQSIIDALNTRYGLSSSADQAFLRSQLIALTTDVMFRVPAIKEAGLYAARNLTDAGNQLYMISYDDNIGENAFAVNGLGAFHGLDLQYLFAAPGTRNMLGNKTNEKITRQMRLLWGYVANFGTGFGDQYDPRKGNFLQLGHDQVWTKSQDGSLADLVHFWEKIAVIGCTVATPSVAHASLLAVPSANRTRSQAQASSSAASRPSGGTGFPGGGIPNFFQYGGARSLMNFNPGGGRLLGIIQI